MLNVLRKFLAVLGILFIMMPFAFAQGADEEVFDRDTLLPETELNVSQCEALFRENVKQSDLESKVKPRNRESLNILGCGIKTGDIKLWMLPYYVRYMLEFVLGVSGIAAIAGVIYGGYLYLFAKVSDDPDRGKKAITYGVGGFVMTMLAWAIVNILIALLTS